MKVRKFLPAAITAASFIAALSVILFSGFLKDKNYGPGAYYYSDIPGWERIFPATPPVSEGRIGILGAALVCFTMTLLFFMILRRISGENNLKRITPDTEDGI